jgi:hypothetical protein
MLARMKQTPAQIAESVGRTGAYDRLLQKVMELKAKRAALVAAQREMIASAKRDQMGSEITALARRIETLDIEMRPLSAQLPELREQHGRRLDEALAPLRREVAGRLLATLDQMEADAYTLEEIGSLIEGSGHRPAFGRVPPWFASLREHFARIAAL